MSDAQPAIARAREILARRDRDAELAELAERRASLAMEAAFEKLGLVGPPAEHRSVTVTKDEAERLCRAVWDAPYIPYGIGGRASSIGNCVDKALRLQADLGGVVASGWTPEGERHALLIFTCDGTLMVADRGTVAPLAKFPFRFDGFYTPGKQ